LVEDSLPPLHLVKCDANRREPGIMLFNVRPSGNSRAITKTSWIIGIDRSGDVAFQLKSDEPIQDVRLHPNGNIFYSEPGAGLINEIDFSGRHLRQWHAVGKWEGSTPPTGSTAIATTRIHHTMDVLPNGNLLLLSNEPRQYDDWPGSDTDPDAPRETATVIGDIILEVTLGGEIKHQWHMLDILDPYRICYGSRRSTTVNQDWQNSNDWAHANSASYDASDGSILVSLRTQDCMIKIDRASGTLKWVLGSPNNWRKPWSKKLLTPKKRLEWQYHQHDCSVTPSGTILCFDNGNHRATPFEPPMPAIDSYSRAAEFLVDEDAQTVEQVWSYGDSPSDRLFGCFQGGALRLPETGNTFITYGGVATMDGAPTADNTNGFGRARLIEVSPAGEVLFDLWVDSSGQKNPLSYSVFRADHIPKA
jgi:hypothetical protein